MGDDYEAPDPEPSTAEVLADEENTIDHPAPYRETPATVAEGRTTVPQDPSIPHGNH